MLSRLQGTLKTFDCCIGLINVRNREGLNDWVYEREHPEDAKKDT